MNNKVIKLFQNSADLFQTAVGDFVQRAHAAIAAKGVFTVVLLGGTTAKVFFDELAEYKEKIPWDKIKFFFGDERYVPCDQEESNYYMAKQHLFSKLPVLAENIYPIPTEFSDPKIAAQTYEMTLRKAFNLQENEFPRFDVVYLGLGEDAHTASLMPFSDIVMSYSKPKNKHKNDQLVASLWVPELNMHRITLTPDAISQGAAVCFLVTGENKASAVWHVLEGSFDPQQYPAQLIQCVNEKTIWFLDKGAAAKLNV